MNINQSVNDHHVGDLTAGLMATKILEKQKKSACIALLWLKKSTDQTEKLRVTKLLEGVKGVIETKIMREQPTILQVDYCSKEIKAETIVNLISAQGSVVKRVGC